MLTLNDGRSELWQWDTGRKLTVDADCTQVHFSNKFFGRSVDVDVFDGTAEIPDVLLQVDKDLFVWAFVGAAENGYTKISKVFKVNKRNKPADYVFTPTEQTTLDEIMKRLSQIEESQDPDAIKNAVDEYLANNPIQVEEKDPTVPDWAKQPTKPEYTVQEVGAVATVNGIAPDENGNVQIPVSGGNVDQAQIEQAVADYLEEHPVEGGTPGADGEDGASAYEIAQNNGFEGSETEWLASLKGEPGKDGSPGTDGYTPVKGVDYFDGEDGLDGHSPVVTATKSGKVTSIEVDGVQIATINDGKDGTDGKTPAKGTDYWTDADKAEIKAYVDDAILGGAW